MTASNWIELASLIITLLGGGAVGASKLTRIAAAAENLAEQIKTVAEQQKVTSAMVQSHENRLNKAQL